MNTKNNWAKLCLLNIAIGLSSVQAATFSVNTGNDLIDDVIGDGVCATIEANCSLRAAVQESNALMGADVINIIVPSIQITLAGTDEEAALTGDFDITDELSINGMGMSETVIDANGLDRVFQVHGTSLSLSAMTLSNGAANNGGALYVRVDSSLNLNQIKMQNNVANGSGLNNGEGGALYNRGTVSGEDVVFTGNEANSIGGAVISFDDSTDPDRTPVQTSFKNCLFQSNQAVAGGVWWANNFDPVTKIRMQNHIENCLFIENNAINSSIIANDTRSDFFITNSTFTNNEVGGSIILNDGGSAVFIHQSTFVNNVAGAFSDVHNSPELVTVSNSVLSNNIHTLAGEINCAGRFTSEGGNYFGTIPATCLPEFHASDITGGDDLSFTPLYGTDGLWDQVLLPFAGSPLLDAALDNTCSEFDQAGVTRPLDTDFDGTANCTIGASERSEIIFLNGF